MNRRHVFILFGSAFLLIGLALTASIPGPVDATRPVAGSSIDLAAFRLDAALQCNIKVPGGLAQCGSQASSCKNCHEVKGEDPVNAKGEWHISHAFGDFCEFCHGGNVQAPDKAAAHQGLVAPLDDVKTNCASCHEDYQTKAETYAVALGVTIGTGGGGSSASVSLPSNPSEPIAPAPEPISAPSGTEIVDYAAEYQSGGAPQVNTGNVVLGILLALTVVGGGSFVFWNERRLRKIHSPTSTSQPVASTVEIREQGLEISDDLSPELVKLLPTLQSLDPRTLRALRIILSDRKRGQEMLQSLSLINFGVLDEMKRLEKRELSLLLALAAES